MDICDRFNEKIKHKMKSIIRLSRIIDKECCTLIMKNYTLGKVSIGQKESCRENKNFLEYFKGDAIGDFHTHPYSKRDFKKFQDELSPYIKNYKEVEHLIARPSSDDIESIFLRNLNIECIGIYAPINKEYRLYCYEFYEDKNILYNKVKDELKKYKDRIIFFEKLKKYTIKNQSWTIL
jgi:hypothetical protein